MLVLRLPHLLTEFQSVVYPINLADLLVVYVDCQEQIKQLWPGNCIHQHVSLFVAKMAEIYEKDGTLYLTVKFELEFL